jgi:hypothetical protein
LISKMITPFKSLNPVVILDQMMAKSYRWPSGFQWFKMWCMRQ